LTSPFHLEHTESYKEGNKISNKKVEPTVYVNFSIDIVIAQKKRVDKRWKQLTTQKKTWRTRHAPIAHYKVTTSEDTSVA